MLSRTDFSISIVDTSDGLYEIICYKNGNVDYRAWATDPVEAGKMVLYLKEFYLYHIPGKKGPDKIEI